MEFPLLLHWFQDSVQMQVVEAAAADRRAHLVLDILHAPTPKNISFPVQDMSPTGGLTGEGQMQLVRW